MVFTLSDSVIPVNTSAALIMRTLLRRAAGALIAIIMAFTSIAHSAHALSITGSPATLGIEDASQPESEAPTKGKIGDQCQSHPSATVIPAALVVPFSKASALPPVSPPASLTPADLRAATPPPRG
jgi:hypothetical protein